MADEEKKQSTPIDPENPPEAIKATQDKSVRELRDVPMEEISTEKLPEIVKEVKEGGETPPERTARREVETTLNQPIEAVEDAVNALDTEDKRTPAPTHGLPHRVGDVTVIAGRTIPYPLYTVVFGALAIVTLIEVAISQVPHGWLSTIILLSLSLTKAGLVIWFYMHLRSDSRVYLVVLLLPFFIALVSLLFLVTVPMTSY